MCDEQSGSSGPLAAVKNGSTMHDPKQKGAVAAGFMNICFLSPAQYGE